MVMETLGTKCVEQKKGLGPWGTLKGHTEISKKTEGRTHWSAPCWFPARHVLRPPCKLQNLRYHTDNSTEKQDAGIQHSLKPWDKIMPCLVVTIIQCFSYLPSSANVMISTCWSHRVPLLLTSRRFVRPSTAWMFPELRSTCFSLPPSGEQSNALKPIAGTMQRGQASFWYQRTKLTFQTETSIRNIILFRVLCLFG